jgi:hypothetical protein
VKSLERSLTWHGTMKRTADLSFNPHPEVMPDQPLHPSRSLRELTSIVRIPNDRFGSKTRRGAISVSMSGFPESGRRKSLFDHLADAWPFARRLHLRLPADLGFLEQGAARTWRGRIR